ncbi:hypothetical protein [Neobacillus niacini]|nr:hypothetical protein [Neobacillus niacini]
MSLVGLLKEQFPLGMLYVMASSLFIIGAIAMLPMQRMKQGK